MDSSSTPLDQRTEAEQRQILASRGISTENLDRLADNGERGIAVDGYKARPVILMPTSSSPLARDVTVVHDIATGQRTVYADDVAGDTQTSGDAIVAAAQVRAADRAGEVEQYDATGARTGVYDGLAEIARGTKVAGQKRNDRVGNAKPLVGVPLEQLNQRLGMGGDGSRRGRPRKGSQVRERFSVRMEPSKRAELRDATGVDESALLDKVHDLVDMARSGAQAADLLAAVMAMAGASDDVAA